MAFCKACGQDAGNASFCPKCGVAQSAAQIPSQSAPQFAAQSASSGSAASAPAAASPTAGLDENIAGLLCYVFGWLSGLIFLLIDKRPFVKFHGAQSIALNIGFVAVWILYAIFSFVLTMITAMMHFPIGFLSFFLLPIIGIAFLGTWIFMMYKAYSHEKFKLPVIGNIVEKMVGQ
jgi:uncharacterized membrane protein